MITASILCKKLAEGLDALVMDVKVGSGAFMTTYALSEQLAQSIVSVASRPDCRTTALLTDMNQVLAPSAGNVLEVREAVRFLTGEHRNSRLYGVTMSLCIEMLLAGRLAENSDEARQRLQAVLDNGRAAEVFGRIMGQRILSNRWALIYRQLCSVNRYLPPISVLLLRWALGMAAGFVRRGRYRPQRRVRRRGEPGR